MICRLPLCDLDNPARTVCSSCGLKVLPQKSSECSPLVNIPFSIFQPRSQEMAIAVACRRGTQTPSRRALLLLLASFACCRLKQTDQKLCIRQVKYRTMPLWSAIYAMLGGSFMSELNTATKIMFLMSMTKVLTTVSQAMLEDTPLTSRHLLAADSCLRFGAAAALQHGYCYNSSYHKLSNIISQFECYIPNTSPIESTIPPFCGLWQKSTLVRFWWLFQPCFIRPFLRSRKFRNPKPSSPAL